MRLFRRRTAEDGVTHNPILALNAQIWPLTVLHGAAGKFASAMTTAEQRMSVGGGFLTVKTAMVCGPKGRAKWLS